MLDDVNKIYLDVQFLLLPGFPWGQFLPGNPMGFTIRESVKFMGVTYSSP